MPARLNRKEKTGILQLHHDTEMVLVFRFYKGHPQVCCVSGAISLELERFATK